MYIMNLLLFIEFAQFFLSVLDIIMISDSVSIIESRSLGFQINHVCFNVFKVCYQITRMETQGTFFFIAVRNHC